MATQNISFFIFLITLLSTVFIESKLIPYLRKKAEQPIYQEGPNWHISKQGTPTMGGIAFLISISLSLIMCSIFRLSFRDKPEIGISIIISILYAVGNSLVGIVDDLTKLRRKHNEGLTPSQKLLLQSLLALLFLMARSYFFGRDTQLSFFFGRVDLGFLYYPFSFLILLGIVNCANLTDGVDGLAASVALTISFVFALSYFLIPQDVAFISAALVGGALGFLIFNANPAKIFMGDTGSLFLGALIASLGFSLGNPLLAVIFGAVYVLEGLSVVIQVIFFKITGQRIFKMAPIHHHLEKCGIGEGRICVIAAGITIVFSLLALMLIG